MASLASAAAASRGRLRPASERRAACRAAAEARMLRRQGVDGDLGSALHICSSAQIASRVKSRWLDCNCEYQGMAAAQCASI